MAEVRMGGAGRDYQLVVRHFAFVVGEPHDLRRVSIEVASPRITCAFRWRRTIRRIGEAMSLGFSAAVATW